MLLEEEFNIGLRWRRGPIRIWLSQERPGAYAKALKGQQNILITWWSGAELFPTRSPEGKERTRKFLLPHIHRVPTELCATSWPLNIAQKLNIDTRCWQEFKAAAG